MAFLLSQVHTCQGSTLVKSWHGFGFAATNAWVWRRAGLAPRLDGGSANAPFQRQSDGVIAVGDKARKRDECATLGQVLSARRALGCAAGTVLRSKPSREIG